MASTDLSLSHREDGVRRRVLYAEDQPTARFVTTALLERMGFEVVAVEDGELALAEAKQGLYDIILLDIEMPVMDGVTAARQIRKEAALCKETPILALSAFLADSTEHCHWRGAFDSALPKPANGNELRQAMQQAIIAKSSGQGQRGLSSVPLWRQFGAGLPKGTLIILARAAHDEMCHLVNCLAASQAAGDKDGMRRCQIGLKSIAGSFCASEVAGILQQELDADAMRRLKIACDDWFRKSLPDECEG